MNVRLNTFEKYLVLLDDIAYTNGWLGETNLLEGRVASRAYRSDFKLIDSDALHPVFNASHLTWFVTEI